MTKTVALGMLVLCALGCGVSAANAVEPARGLCSAATALRRSGHLEEAEDAYRAILRYHPARATCVATGLTALANAQKKAKPKPRAFEQAWLAERWHELSPWLLVPAIVATLAVVLTWVLWRALFRLPTVRLAEIQGSPDDRKTLGAELVAGVRDALEQFASRPRGLVVGSWGDEVEIPGAVTSAVPQTKLVAALLQLLQRLPVLRRLARQYELSGQLRTADGQLKTTYAVTGRTGEQVSVVTLAASAFDPAATTKSTPEPSVIAPAAGAWLIYQLYALRPPGRRAVARVERWLGRLGLSAYGVVGSPKSLRRVLPTLLDLSLRGSPPLGSPTWRSFASFSAGARLHDDPKRQADARGLYLSALNDDPESRVALFNLARLDFTAAAPLEDDDPDVTQERERIITETPQRLLRIKKRIEAQYPVRRLPVQFDPLWYRATYSAAAVPVSLLRDAQPSLIIAKELVRVLEGTLLVARKRRDAALRRFLLEIEPAVLALYAIAFVLANGATPAPALEWPPPRRQLVEWLDDLDHRIVARYIDTCTVVPRTTARNLASYYSLAAGVETDEARRLRYLRRALVELRAMVERRGAKGVAVARSGEEFAAVRDAEETREEFERLCRFGETPLI